MLLRTHSLRFRLIGLGLLINLMIVGLISAVTLYSLHDIARRDLATQLATLDRLVSATLLEPVSSQDLNTLYGQVERFTRYDNIVYLAVRSPQGDMLASSAWNAATPRRHPTNWPHSCCLAATTRCFTTG